jgi:hypothetical protein
VGKSSPKLEISRWKGTLTENGGKEEGVSMQMSRERERRGGISHRWRDRMVDSCINYEVRFTPQLRKFISSASV